MKIKIPKTLSQGYKNPLSLKGQGLWIAFGLFVVSALLWGPATSASTVSETFSSNDQFLKGSIVSVNPKLPDDIELSTINNSAFLLGVVNDADDSTISFKKNNSSISVALSGEVSVFVSDVKGDIKRGDFIGASWLEGVGMKAEDNEEQKLVGIAQEDFNSADAKEYGSIDTPEGSKNIRVGLVAVRLFDKEGARTSLLSNSDSNSGVQGAFSTIVGKDVSLTKILIGSLLFVVSLVVSGVFVSSSIKGSFISIGRNPMAGASIHRGMIRVAIVSVVIILTGTVISYAVLAV